MAGLGAAQVELVSSPILGAAGGLRSGATPTATTTGDGTTSPTSSRGGELIGAPLPTPPPPSGARAHAEVTGFIPYVALPALQSLHSAARASSGALPPVEESRPHRLASQTGRALPM